MRQFVLVVEGEVFGCEAVVFGIRAVIVLWFAVDVGEASADECEFDAGAC